jgi:hypothetical protein
MKTINCEVKVTLRAPLPFVFSWCTDYQPSDSKLEKEHYMRKIIQRTSRRVVFEDLQEMRDGWSWQRAIVMLHPPNRWHMENTGNRRDLAADYVLTKLPEDRTQLYLRWKVWPKTVAAAKLGKAARERSVASAWRRFAAALEEDYRHLRNRRTR